MLLQFVWRSYMNFGGINQEKLFLVLAKMKASDRQGIIPSWRSCPASSYHNLDLVLDYLRFASLGPVFILFQPALWAGRPISRDCLRRLFCFLALSGCHQERAPAGNGRKAVAMGNWFHHLTCLHPLAEGQSTCQPSTQNFQSPSSGSHKPPRSVGLPVARQPNSYCTISYGSCPTSWGHFKNSLFKKLSLNGLVWVCLQFPISP